MANKPEENLTNLSFPMRGIDLENPFDLQPPFTTPTGVNVRGYEPITLRARGGSRPGLEAYADVLPTGSVIQHLEAIVDPQAEALTADFELEPLPQWEYMDDPSTNNLRTRNRGRRVRVGGSGRQENINIGKQRVVITWADPADITVGTALSGTQLNATAATTNGFPVSGSFAYTPPSGTVLTEGEGRPLKAVFTPTDSGLYAGATKTVHINVTTIDQDAAADTVTNPTGASASLFLPAVSSGQLLLFATVRENCTIASAPNDGHNTYTLLETGTNGTLGIDLWSCVSTFSGSLNPSVGFLPIGAPTFSFAMAFVRYSGNAAAPIDSHVFGTAWTTPSIPVNNPGSLVVGVFGSSSSGGFTPDAGQRLRCNVVDVNPQPSIYVVDIRSINAARTMGGTPNFAASNVAIGASFKMT